MFEPVVIDYVDGKEVADNPFDECELIGFFG